MEKAKEAYRKERLLIKQRDEKNLSDQINPELTGFVKKQLIYSFRPLEPIESNFFH